MRWRDFIQQNADKILLIVLLHALMAVMLTAAKDTTLVDWVKGEASTVMGALIMLITGRATKPETVATTTTTTSTSVTPPVQSDPAQPVPAPAEPLAPSGIDKA